MTGEIDLDGCIHTVGWIIFKDEGGRVAGVKRF